MKLSGILAVLLILLLPFVSAEEKYTFERAEELTPLIEWRDYTPEAFQEAVDENKPIFLLLTAPSWCYWCQVYESEDYLFHPDMVAFVNENTIPIYVDADKRQDLTRQWLEGGWPSTTILTPGRERIYGYSGVRPVANMIENLGNAVSFVKTHEFSLEISYNYQKTKQVIPTERQLEQIINNYAGVILQAYDSVHGGFGGGQKFPRGRTLDFALELYEQTNDKKWLELVENTLANQYTKLEEISTNYNLFDPVEGGFHRYGTQRDWTPPHYEKMLYDNAKLLKAYYHLLQITEDAITKEVVSKTIAFIEENWYDPEGGFYGNSDVHGEDAYYGKNPRTLPKPRVEKTKYTNWNAEAILTYLYIWETSKDEKFKIMASDTLDFFAKEMVSKEGAFHYEKDGEKGITGNLLDNAYLLLAFTEGYTVLGEEKYLDVGEQLADYSLDNLYDWHSGGFFERNSKDTDNYAPGEHIVLSKPNEENGIIAYALLTLYKQTGNKLYLNAGLKTMGSKLNGIGSLDQGYYYIKAAQLIRQDGLLADFARLEEEITTIEKEKQEDFWLDDILSDEFRVSDTGVEKLKGPFLLLILIALFAGLISFMSPCTLPILPAYLAYSFKSSQKNIKGMTLMFFAGLLMVFTLLGLSATIIGSFLKGNSALFSKIAGVIIIGLGVFILSGKGFKNLGIKKERPATYLGSFLFGTVMGISWSPCVDPILIALLLLASTTGSFITGGLLLFIYGIGLALPLIVLSFYISKINKEGWLWKMIKGKGIEIELSDNRTFFIHSSSLISGVLFIILGYLIFSGTLFAFNQYIASTKFQAIIFKLEEYILGLIGR